MQVGAGSQLLLNNVERFGLYVANSEDNTSTILSRPNIGILMCFAYTYLLSTAVQWNPREKHQDENYIDHLQIL